MPQVVVYAGWELFLAEMISAEMALLVLGNATFIGNSLLLIGAYSYQERQKRKMRNAYNAAQVDRLANVSTTTGPRELVLGKVRKGGVIVFRESCGELRDRFVMVTAIAAHEIDGIETYYLNDQKVTLDASGNVLEAPYATSTTESVTVNGHIVPEDAINGVYEHTTTSPYGDSGTPGEPITVYQRLVSGQSKANIRLYTGTLTQTADARLIELFPNVWTANHKLTGIAYLISEFVFDETAFPSGLPALTVTVRGAKVFDPRSEQTVWSDNPALHALHVVTHPYFGKRTTLTARELARVSAAANACDELYTPAGSTTSRPLYQSGTVLPYGSRATDALDDICIAMCGAWAYAGGEFFIKAGKYTAPVAYLNESHFLTSQLDSASSENSKQVVINPQRSKADRINTVYTKIYDSEVDYKETTLKPVVNTGMLAIDGRELSTELTLPTVTSASQGQVVANYMLKESTDTLSITATFKMLAYPIELFDTVSLTVAKYGWSSKEFTVSSKKVAVTGDVEFTLVETSPELYNPLVAADSDGYADNGNPIQPWEVFPPENLVAFSGTNELSLQSDGTLLTRVRVQWNAITDYRITQGGFVEVQWQPAGSETWNSITVSGIENACYITGVVDSQNIVIRARSRYALAVSDWGAQLVHTVLGKTEPPSSVTEASVAVEDQNLVARWTPISDVDAAGYEIRTSDADWGTPGFVFQGDGTSTLITFYASTSVWYIKAYDRSGNYSVTAKSISFTGYTSITSGVSMNLSNEVHVLPASSDGVIAPTSYVGSGTSIRIYEGANELEYDGVGTTAGTWKVTLSAFNITAGALSDTGTYVTVADHSGVADNVDIAAITYTATGKNSAGTAFTIVKTQSFSKTKSGTNPIIYAISTSSPVITKDAPDVATDGAYSSITIQGKKYEGNVTSNYGWITVTANGATEATTATDTSTTPVTLAPATNADKSSYTIKLYNQATVSGATLLDSQTIPVVFKGASGSAGATGLTATIDMSGLSGFKKNAGGAFTPTSMVVTAVTSNITSPSFAWAVTGATFTPATGSSTTITPSAGSDVISVTLTVTSTSLASPMSIKRSVAVAYDGAAGEAGANGVMSAFPTIYIWTANSTPPARPTTTSSYTWGTGAFTPPTNWSTIPPSNTVPGNYLWSITVPLTVSATTTTSTLDWTNTANAIRGIAYNGSNGDSGLSGTRTAVMDMYQWATTPPTAFPVGNSTYTWSTSQFTAPATLNGWSLTPPAPVVGSSLYVVRQIYADSLSATTTTIPWTATSSEPFTVGTTGTRTAFLELYIWSAATPTTFPSGTSSYTWASGSFTLPATPNGWSRSPGAAVAGLRLWGCQVSLTTTGTTTPTSVTWNTATAYDVGFGVTGSNGAPGSATFLVTRSEDVSTAPTDPEVQAAINRLPVAGDICTISYNNGNNSTAYKYITSWTLQTTYITGSLIVQNSISGDRMIANSIAVSKLTNGVTSAINGGSFSLGAASTINGFSSVGALSQASAGYNAINGFHTSTSDSSGSAAVAGAVASTSNFGGAFFNATNANYNSFRSYVGLASGTYALKARLPRGVGTIGNLSFTDQTSAELCSADNALYAQNFGTSATNRVTAVYICNTSTLSAAVSRKYDTSTGTSLVTESYLCTDTYSLYGTKGKGYILDGYAPFTGIHDGLLDSNTVFSAGDIVVDKQVLSRMDISNAVVLYELSSRANQKGVAGVLNRIFDTPPQDWLPAIQIPTPSVEEGQEELPPEEPIVNPFAYDVPAGMKVVHINALGEGLVNVCGENGDIEVGDLIVTSSIPGKGMRQSDDLVRSCSVAKSRENVTFSNTAEVKQIACFYISG